MESLPLWLQILFLLFLTLCSAFFSGSETGMMSLNKHRLRHLADEGDSNAKTALNLLKRPDKLLGTILLGNNLMNNIAAALTGLIGASLMGDSGAFIFAAIFTVMVLVFGEVTPKTYAAMNAEKFALPIAGVLAFLQRLLAPIVNLINSAAALLLRQLGIDNFNSTDELVSKEELKSMIQVKLNATGDEHDDMMLGLLYLEDIFIEDIMIAKQDIIGLDLDGDWKASLDKVVRSDFARFLLYRENINEIVGVLHARDLLKILYDNTPLTPENVESVAQPAYFIPEGTSLHKQLSEFQKNKRQTGVVVNEYGDVQGLLTLEDILEYVVGDLALKEIAESVSVSQDIIELGDDHYRVDGALSVRYFNKETDWRLPVDGAKSIGGLVVENLGRYPEVGTAVQIGDYELTVKSFSDHRVRTVTLRSLAPKETEDA